MLKGSLLERIRREKPRVHCMANHVTANDCANLLLAVGASPIMADDPLEAAEVTALCGALVLSLGTPSERRIEAMLLSGAQANRQGIPVVFDPVGVTASEFRRDAAARVLKRVRLAVIRGNASEIRLLAGESVHACGVDAADEAVGAQAAMRLAERTGAVVLVTGEADVVTDGERLCLVHNGHPMMRSVTGAGCQLSALLGAFAAAGREDCYEAAVSAAVMMGLCGETAYSRLSPLDGNAAYRNYVIDAAYRMTQRQLEEGANIEQG